VASYYVENFGCRATQADGAAIERQFESLGLEPAKGSDSAKVVVLNTCTVTAAADQDARAAIRRIRRENPHCRMVVTGCYAQRAPEEISQLPGVDQIIGNSDKHRLAQLALGSFGAVGRDFVPLSDLSGQSIFVSDIFAHTELMAAPVFDAPGNRTRPNLKIQDGCDNRCSFCVIPYVRGQSRSMKLERVLEEINVLVAAGYKEVVISGINLGRWGRDLPTPQHFEGIICSILDRTTLEKLRISSVEPMDWSDELINLVASSPRIAKHAHVPMQSGSDRVLRTMHRKYRPWHYREKVEKIRDAVPDAAIGADVMVGFPGETEADFEETRRMIEKLPLTYLHVFTYSARPGTPASSMSKQVAVHIARERNQILRGLGLRKKAAFMLSFIGKTLQAITLNVVHCGDSGEYTEALTDNYLKLWIRGRHLPNQWLRTRIADVSSGHLVGKVEPRCR